MTLIELEETLNEVLNETPFQIVTNKKGEVVIHTGYMLDDDGELVTEDDEMSDDLLGGNADDLTDRWNEND
jgi:hypothetical protein